ncbi:MAG: MbnP family protein [Candidatus Kapaibacteriota bacterium]
MEGSNPSFSATLVVHKPHINIINFTTYSILSLVSLFVLCSCTDQSVSVNQTGTANISIQHVFSDKPFVLGKQYTLPTGEQINASMLRYYMSNIILEKSDGSRYAIPQDASYFLVDEKIPTSKMLKLSSIPTGTYTKLYLTIGVDSLRCTMGLEKRTGVLDIGAAAQDMYWSWNSGYIHFKMEGTFTAPSGITGDMRFHVGGFGGYSSPTINAVRNISLDLSNTPLIINENGSKTLHLNADLQKVFTGKQSFSVAENSSVMFSNFSTTIADNYATMFSVLTID